MQVYFREITPQDISAIKKITQDIWEGEDYIPKNIEFWLQNKDAFHVGLFIESHMKPTSLIGFVRIRTYMSSLFWIEAGRIDPEYQQKGYGYQLAEYAINFAIHHGATRIQYDTWASRENMGDPQIPQNHGSIRLANSFGFARKTYVDALLGDLKEIKFPSTWNHTQPQPIKPKNVLTTLEQIVSAPMELNHGWNYIPAQEDVILNLGTHESFWFNGDAFAHVIQNPDFPIGEGPDRDEFWIIVYGKVKTACHLIYDLIFHLNLPKNVSNVTVFTYPHISDQLLQYGFHFFEEDPSGVVLFEKVIKKP